MALPGEGLLPGTAAGQGQRRLAPAREPGNERRGGGQLGKLRGGGARLCAVLGSVRGTAGAARVRAAGAVAGRWR